MSDRNEHKWSIKLLLVTLIFSSLSSCNNAKIKTQSDTPQQGTINISVDESFKPVIEEQIKVYESTYPNAHIVASYKPEADCFKDLQQDSTRLIIVARGLTGKETDYYKETLQYKPQFLLIAYDAVVIIVNQNCKDSVLVKNPLMR